MTERTRQFAHDFVHAACLPIVLLLGCVESTKTKEPKLHTTIGPEGGSISVGSGEIVLTVPAGALNEAVNFVLETGAVQPLPGLFGVGLAFAWSPKDVRLQEPAELVIPFDPARVSSAVTSSELRVAFRSESGQVSGLLPTSIDGNRITFQTKRLGTFWVTAPDVVASEAIFPLYDGDEYRYDSGLVVKVVRTTEEPNFASAEVAKVVFLRNGLEFGLYLDNLEIALKKLGDFDSVGFQEILGTPVLLASPREAVGTTRPAIGSTAVYEPFGSTTIDHEEIVATTIEIAEHERVYTTLG